MGWKDLSIRDKAAIIRQSVSNGIYNLGEIRNRFDEGGEKDGNNQNIQITLDEFMKQKADSVRNAAHAMSLSRENTKDPIVYVDTEPLIKEYEQGLKEAEMRYSPESARVQLPIPGHNIAESESSLLNARYPINYGRGTEKYLNTLANLEQYRSDWYDNLPFTPFDEKLRELGEGVLDNYKAEADMYVYGKLLAEVKNGPKVIETNGANCISTATDNYGKGHWVTGNQSFAADPSKYGFKEISVADVQPGDVVQNTNRTHGMIFNRLDDNGIPRFNYANGAPGGLEKDSVYSRATPFTDEFYHAYRFVGNEADRKKWEKEFNGKANGGDINTINHPKYNAGQVNPMYDYLRENGLTNEQASGLLGNLAVESYLNADMKQINGSAYGLMQAEGSRKKAMLAYNETPYSFGSGLSPEEQQQLDYIINKGIKNYTIGEWGSTGFSGARKAREAFLKANTTRKASDIITTNYLRPGKPAYSRRRKMSDYYYDTQKERIPYQIESWSNILKSWEQ